jgi:rod shape-determining protein MreC
MESLINRYRNITVLVLVILAQLVLLALQVKNDKDVRMIRVWSVTAVTPLARTIEAVRSGTFGFLKDYVLLRDAHEENRRLKTELDRMKMENVFLRTELSTADRAKALAQFQERTPSRTLASRVIGSGASANSKLVFLDRGSSSGVLRGMGVVTPDGIVGKVVAAYPTASEVLLVTDLDFAAGVVSQKNHVRGTLKGQGYQNCKIDYVPNEEKVEVGEMFYTSGDDRIFPKGFPAAVVRVVRRGPMFQEIVVEPTGVQHGVEEVLILLEGVSQVIPDAPPPVATPVYIGAPPPQAPAPAPAAAQGQPGQGQPGQGQQPPAPQQAAGTAADKLLERYKQVGEAQGHKFGEGLPGSKPPNFNLEVPPGGAPGAKPAAAKPAGTAPAPRPTPPPAAKPQDTVPGGTAPVAAAPKPTAPVPQAKPAAKKQPETAKPATAYDPL